MTSQQELEALLRLIISVRKTPVAQAMAQVKALQGVNLRNIKQIAEADLKTVEGALKDAKGARSLQNACKAALKRGDQGVASPTSTASKRPVPSMSSELEHSDKRSRKDDFHWGPTMMTPEQLEKSLELPLNLNESLISASLPLETNRAPLVLAFAVELLRYTMPEQPLSSRLSLAQAVVSANSRTKAVSIGLEKGKSADDEGWGEGQPRVRVMGREVAVLKRGGYEWKGEEKVGYVDEAGGDQTETQESRTQPATSQTTVAAAGTTSWSASQPLSLKESTFIARATNITEPSKRKELFRSLMDANPQLKTAEHNAWACRIRPAGNGSGVVREESFDDGETGCGDLMLRIMKEVGAVDTMVVLTRWFGGILLGPDRWRLMRTCVTTALAERLRKSGAEVALGGQAVWGLDLEGMKKGSSGRSHGSYETTVVGMQIHRPEAARNYLLQAFGTAADSERAPTGNDKKTSPEPKKKTPKAERIEKEQNLGLLLGALRLVYDSWADHLTPAELDSRAWSWYVAVRPAVAEGQAGWGAKGSLRLSTILNLQRRERS